MKTKNTLMICGGLLAAFASIIPLTTYAANPDTAVVQVSVQPAISIDASAGTGDSLTASSNELTSGSISATITSNSAYTISLHAAQTDLKNGSDNTNVIPASSAVQIGSNAWGIKKKAADNSDSDATGYTAITTSPEVFYKSTAGVTGKQTTFAVGISVASTLPSGTYSTEVTITAATTQSN